MGNVMVVAAELDPELLVEELVVDGLFVVVAGGVSFTLAVAVWLVLAELVAVTVTVCAVAIVAGAV
jgi:hypothetical protein